MTNILFCDEIVTDVATLWMYCLSLLTSAYQGVPLPNWTWHASQLSNGWWHHVLRRISLVFMILPGQWETKSHQFGRLFRTTSFSFSLKAFIWHLIITSPAFWTDAHWLLSTGRIRLSRWFDFYDGVFRFDFYRKFCSAKVSEYFTPHHRRPELCIQSDLEALKYFLRAKIWNISSEQRYEIFPQSKDKKYFPRRQIWNFP